MYWGNPGSHVPPPPPPPCAHLCLAPLVGILVLDQILVGLPGAVVLQVDVAWGGGAVPAVPAVPAQWQSVAGSGGGGQQRVHASLGQGVSQPGSRGLGIPGPRGLTHARTRAHALVSPPPLPRPIGKGVLHGFAQAEGLISYMNINVSLLGSPAAHPSPAAQSSSPPPPPPLAPASLM